MLVSPGGQGKSYLTATSPGPILIADLEGASAKLPRPSIFWSMEEVKAGTFPANLSADSIVTVVPESVNAFGEVVSALHSPDSPFVSFWADSVTVLAQMGSVEIVRKKANIQQGYGELLNLLSPMFIGLKHLTARPDMKLEVVGVTAWQREDKVAPNINGSIASFFSHTYDIVGYVSIDVINGKLGQHMQIMPDPGKQEPKAKGLGSMYLKYGQVMDNPNFSSLNQETKNEK